MPQLPREDEKDIIFACLNHSRRRSGSSIDAYRSGRRREGGREAPDRHCCARDRSLISHQDIYVETEPRNTEIYSEGRDSLTPRKRPSLWVWSTIYCETVSQSSPALIGCRKVVMVDYEELR